MNNQDLNIYIPEYNPLKYKKAIKISKIISLVSLIAMILGIVIVLLKAYLDSNSFLVNVNGVLQKDWSWIIILLGIVVAVFGLTSLFAYVLHIRLKQANAVFSEPDESKRIAMHSKFDAQARKAAKVHAAYTTANIASNSKK